MSIDVPASALASLCDVRPRMKNPPEWFGTIAPCSVMYSAWGAVLARAALCLHLAKPMRNSTHNMVSYLTHANTERRSRASERDRMLGRLAVSRGDGTFAKTRASYSEA